MTGTLGTVPLVTSELGRDDVLELNDAIAATAAGTGPLVLSAGV
jgi:hypothetical protein